MIKWGIMYDKGFREKNKKILNTYTTAKRNFRKRFLLEQTELTNNYSSEPFPSTFLEKLWCYCDLMRQNILHILLHWWPPFKVCKSTLISFELKWATNKCQFCWPVPFILCFADYKTLLTSHVFFLFHQYWGMLVFNAFEWM